MKFFKAGLAVIVSVVPMLSLTVSVSPSRAGLPDFSTAGREVCKDVALGNDTTNVKILADGSSEVRELADIKDTHNNRDTIALASSSESRASSDNKDIEESSGKHSESKSGNVGIFGVKAGGSTQESTENSQRSDNSAKTDEAYKTNNTQNVNTIRTGDNSQKTDNAQKASQKTVFEQATSTVRQGKDCNGIADNITKVEMNEQNNETSLQIVEKKLEAERENKRWDMLKGFIGQ
jgi:hypothetical protein